jgi:hypothetical protein
LWRFNGCSNDNLYIVILHRRQSEAAVNNFATGAASVIKENVGHEDEALEK